MQRVRRGISAGTGSPQAAHRQVAGLTAASALPLSGIISISIISMPAHVLQHNGIGLASGSWTPSSVKPPKARKSLQRLTWGARSTQQDARVMMDENKIVNHPA